MCRRFTASPWIMAGLLLGALGLGGVAIAQETAAQSGVMPAPDAPVLSLAECIGIALDGSLTLAISDQERSSARAGVRGAWGDFMPTLNLTRTIQESSDTDYDQPVPIFDDEGNIIGVVEGQTQNIVNDSSYDDWGGRVNWTVFDGFSDLGGLKSAKASLKAAEATIGYEREMVVQNVSESYLTLLRDERLLTVRQDSRELAARELERSETYFRLGSAAKSAVLSARVRLEQTKLDVVTAQNAVTQSFASLAYHMNQPMARRFAVSDADLGTVDAPVEDPELLFEEALRNRLDLVSRAHTVEARGHDVTVASAGLWPSVNVYYNVSRYTNESPFRFGAQEAQRKSWGAQVSWSALFFDNLNTVTRRSQARATERIAEYQMQQAQLDVKLEIRQLVASLIEARERRNLNQETIVQTEEELRLAQERFRVGAGTALERITAEVNLAQARADEVQAGFDFVIAQAKLDRAVGRAAGY